jgi:hypothetical protein
MNDCSTVGSKVVLPDPPNTASAKSNASAKANACQRHRFAACQIRPGTASDILSLSSNRPKAAGIDLRTLAISMTDTLIEEKDNDVALEIMERHSSRIDHKSDRRAR